MQVIVSLAQRFAFGSVLPFKRPQEYNFRFLNEERFWIHHLKFRFLENNMAVRGRSLKPN